MTANCGGAEMAAQPLSLSTVLVGIGARTDGARVTIGDFIEHLGGRRSFGAALLVLGLFAWLPVWPPGVASIFGLALVGVAVQMVLGRPQPILPGRFLRVGMNAERARRLARRAVPWIQRAERYIRPRRSSLAGPDAERWLGLVILGLALVICVPLPMTNAPPGAAIVVLALGILARDGVFIITGLILAVFGLAVVAAFWTAAWMGLGWALG